MSCNFSMVREATLKHTKQWKEHVLRSSGRVVTAGFKGQQEGWYGRYSVRRRAVRVEVAEGR